MSAAARRHRPFGHWSPEPGQPWVIAGPCSAESLDQVLETARALKADGRTQLFRAGVWKPRTRPGAFEGAGYNALEWLQIMRTEVGLPFVIEVGNPQHVERALAAKADAVWVGARTTVNPFYVQEIAEALKGSQIPVLVKNPIHADVGLWLGALERLDKMGLSDLAAVHADFLRHTPSPTETTRAGNSPLNFAGRFRTYLFFVTRATSPANATSWSLFRKSRWTSPWTD